MHKLTKRYLIWSPDAWHHQIHQSEEGRRRMWRNIKWIQLWNATSWHINIFCFHCFNANQKWLIVRLQFFFKNNTRFLMFPGSDMEEFCCFSSIYVTVHWIILWFWLIGQNKSSNYDRNIFTGSRWYFSPSSDVYRTNNWKRSIVVNKNAKIWLI